MQNSARNRSKEPTSGGCTSDADKIAEVAIRSYCHV